jgi:Fe-S cluster assembly protein SufD
MDLKEKLISSFLAFENSTATDTNIHQIRTESFKLFEQNGFPTKKEEDWKYTSLRDVLKPNYRIFSSIESEVNLNEVKKYFIHEIDTYKLIFVNGIYNSLLSTTTHDGVDICVMSSALVKPKYKMIVDYYFNKIINKNQHFANLNTSFAAEGAFINIPKNVVVSKPIEIIYFNTGEDEELMLQPRNLVVVGENSHIQIIERHQSIKETAVLTNSLTEIFAHKRAIVDFYKIQNDLKTASLIDNTFVSQQKESIVSINTFSFGGKFTRNNLEFYQEDERITSNLNGFSLIEDHQLVDHHTLVHHKKPNCESHEMYKGIFSGNSTGVFNGKIIVNKEAQKTNAFQQNNNMLIDDNASINTKPQLEIFADDVKCSHGCTIGQLDDKAIFYLRSRGIPEKEAKALMLYAFGNEVIEKIKIPELKERITRIIAKKLNVDLSLEL